MLNLSYVSIALAVVAISIAVFALYTAKGASKTTKECRCPKRCGKVAAQVEIVAEDEEDKGEVDSEIPEEETVEDIPEIRTPGVSAAAVTSR